MRATKKRLQFDEPGLYINHVGQLVFIQEQYACDIDGLAWVLIMGGVVYAPKSQQPGDMTNYLLN